MIIVSACLAGIECRYNGSSHTIPDIVEMVKEGLALPICPEILASLPTPRLPAEQRYNEIFSIDGRNVTETYFSGARIALQIALLIGSKKAILKSKSPTCGYGMIYDGTFSNQLIQGDGIFCKLLQENNIKVYTEKSFQTS